MSGRIAQEKLDHVGLGYYMPTFFDNFLNQLSYNSERSDPLNKVVI